MKKFSIKKFTVDRLVNFQTIDKSTGFVPSDKYQNPHTATECKPDLERQKKFLAAMKGRFLDDGWGTKEDTKDMIAWLEEILGSVEFTDDQTQNSFIMYQIERYMHRIWMRGTEEQRLDMGIDIDYAQEEVKPKTRKPRKTKTTEAPKTEEPKAEAPKTRKPRKTKAAEAPKTKVNTKPAPKAKPAGSGKPIVEVEVEEQDKNLTEILLLTFESLLSSLSTDSKEELLLGVTQLLSKYAG